MMQAYALLPSVIEFTGRDRLKWLHSFVTNEIRTLTTETWCETFATDSKGKAFSHGCIFQSNEKLYFLSVSSNQEPGLIAMWDRYIISEDVTPLNVSSQYKWFFLSNANWADLYCTHNLSTDNDSSEPLVQWLKSSNEELIVGIKGFALGAEYTLVGSPVSLFPSLAKSLTMLSVADTQALTARAGFPWFGVDFSKENLPQEVDRDAMAISFKKGCYLGQETIARLDALGQVQKKLFPVSVATTAQLHAPLAISLDAGDGSEPAQAGTLTSAYLSKERTENIGFAMIRRKYFERIDSMRVEGGSSVTLRK